MSVTRARAGCSPGDVDYDMVAQKVVEKLIASEQFIGKLTTIFREIVLSEMGNALQECQHKVSQLEDQLRRSEEENSRLLDDHEQFAKLNNIIIYGLPEDQGEKIEQKMTDLFESKLGITVALSEIDVAYRLRGGTGERKPRPVIVKFVRRLVKKTVVANRSKLKGSRIVIKDDLTGKRATLLKLAGQKYGFKKVWSMDGRIYARLDNKTVKIASSRDLESDGDVPILQQ